MKILSINLWFDKYGHKTLAQLRSFAHFGYDTYAATIREENRQLKCEIYRVVFTGEDTGIQAVKQSGNLSDGKSCTLDTVSSAVINREAFGTAYFSAFRYLFDYASDNAFDIVYMRRLMSKIMYAGPHFRHLAAQCSIVYEIPTFPFDVPANFIYALRDRLEMFAYRRCKKYISVTSCCLYQHGRPDEDWLLFENGIDISNYTIHDVPPLDDPDSVINMLMIANMQSWHRSERILYALKDYSGKHRLRLIVASPGSKEYTSMQELAGELGISDMIEFNDFLPISRINEIAQTCHIAVGQLSGSEYGVMETHAIKHKDYCGLGLPMFSTCTDTSFPDGYPYYYFIKDTDAAIDLDAIIRWYENIRNDHPGYRREMYEHAKDHLQYNGYVKEILDRVNNECPG
ncbi:MAG: hypothetical protein K6E53_14505 [Lachnospiraceae bacterium]|nr:hypothetical protein [Lachnospiraceae bacterium]